MNKILSIALGLVGLLLPIVSLAIIFPPIPAGHYINPYLLISGAFNFIWPIIVAAIIILFIYAGFEFLTAQGDETKLSKARSAVIWGTVGVAVIILSFSIIWIVGFF